MNANASESATMRMSCDFYCCGHVRGCSIAMGFSGGDGGHPFVAILNASANPIANATTVWRVCTDLCLLWAAMGAGVHANDSRFGFFRGRHRGDRHRRGNAIWNGTALAIDDSTS